MDKKKRIEELTQNIKMGQQRIEQMKAQINGNIGAIQILEEQIKEEKTEKGITN